MPPACVARGRCDRSTLNARAICFSGESTTRATIESNASISSSFALAPGRSSSRRHGARHERPHGRRVRRDRQHQRVEARGGRRRVGRARAARRRGRRRPGSGIHLSIVGVDRVNRGGVEGPRRAERPREAEPHERGRREEGRRWRREEEEARIGRRGGGCARSAWTRTPRTRTRTRTRRRRTGEEGKAPESRRSPPPRWRRRRARSTPRRGASASAPRAGRTASSPSARRASSRERRVL